MAGVSTFSPEAATAICERLAGGESLRKICETKGMPSRWSVFRWLEDNEEFRNQYARAREWQAEVIMDEILEIADNTKNDTTTTDFGPKPNAEWISRSRLMVDSRFKLMGQLAPKKYGPRMALTGADGGPLQVETVDARAALLSRLAGDKE